MSSLPEPPSPETLKPLYNYTACDVSDALLKLKVPGAGYLVDLVPYCHAAPESTGVTIAPASTVLFAPKSGDISSYGVSNIPNGFHWVDLTIPETVVVLSQPAGQKNAVCGGIMALRMKVLNAKGVVVGGRIRDIEELKSTGLPMWAAGVSTVGTGAETKQHALNVPVKINGVWVNAGDIMFCDPMNGVVVIPRDRLEEVIELIPKIVAADDKVKEDVANGTLVQEAFKKHRGNL